MQEIPGTLINKLSNAPASSLDDPLKLSLEGLALFDSSDDDIELFLRTLRWMARPERQRTPTSPTRTAATTTMRTWCEN
jgi:hypothetical protein